MRPLLTLIFSLALLLPAQANLVVELTIENQSVESTDLFFDVYLTRHDDSAGDIYLADMDLVLNFNSNFFTDPVLAVVENGMDATGYCEFTAASGLAQDETTCRAEYFANTATATINGNLLTLNLFGPQPPDAADFAARIAWVDGEPNKHRLGTFKISGINDQMGTAGLTWAETSTGTMTKVFSFKNYEPWTGQPVEVMTTEPADITLDSTINATAEELASGFFLEKIFPNPVRSELTLTAHFPAAGAAILQVADLQGRIVLQENMDVVRGGQPVQINVAALPEGSYRVILRSGEMTRTGQFVRQ